MEKLLNEIMEVYKKVYKAMFILHDTKNAMIYKNEYETLCFENNINPHTNKILKNKIDSFIKSMQ